MRLPASRRSARRRLEAAGEGGRSRRGRLESQWRRRKILRSQSREADGGRRVLAFVNDRRDRKSRGPQSCGHAREPHRVHGRRHVERLALIQHGTGVDDACGQAGQAQPRADRFATLHRPQPHRERVGRLRTAQARDGGQSVGREVGVEEKKRARAGPNHLDLLLDGGHRIGRRTAFHTKHAERAHPGARRQLGVAVARRDLGDDPAAGDECDLLIGDRFAPSHAQSVVEARANHAAFIHEVRQVDRAPERRPGRTRGRQNENWRGPWRRPQRGTGKSREHQQVESGIRRPLTSPPAS